MTISGRWLAFFSVILLLLISPYMPPGMAGFLLIIASGAIYIRSGSPYLPAALVIIGLFNLVGILPAFVLYSSLLIIAAGELIFSYTGGRPIEYALSLIGCFLMAAVVMEFLEIQAWVSAVIGATMAVLLHSILGKGERALFGELLGVAMVMLLIQDLEYQADLQLVAIAVVIAFGFSYFAYRLKTADIPGLLSAALTGIILIVFAGISWFIVMLSFFILGSAATRYQADYKKSLHVEQEKGGARGYVNVFANGLVSIGAAIGFGVTHNPAFIAMYVGSVATAAADTVAGEIGVCSGRPYLITTLKPVPEGTNGGISLRGEAAGIFAALFVSGCGLLLGIGDFQIFCAGVLGGFIGANIDSLIGEVFENRKIIGNAGTNLIATFGGGVVTVLLWAIITR